MYSAVKNKAYLLNLSNQFPHLTNLPSRSDTDLVCSNSTNDDNDFIGNKNPSTGRFLFKDQTCMLLHAQCNIFLFCGLTSINYNGLHGPTVIQLCTNKYVPNHLEYIEYEIYDAQLSCYVWLIDPTTTHLRTLAEIYICCCCSRTIHINQYGTISWNISCGNIHNPDGGIIS